MSETPSPALDEIRDRLEHYRQFLGAAEMARLVEALERPRVPAIRINTLKIGVDAARCTWPEWYGWTVQPVPFCAAGWQVLAQDQPIGHTLEYDMGCYYIQDAASMLPAEMFAPDDAPLILDMAAAPGGKTTHLACRFEDRAVIVANDTSASRVTALRSNLQTWGVMGALVTSTPGERFGRWFPETFDKVLLDAPCSGDTLRVSTGRRARTVSDRERRALCQRQGALLLGAFQAVRPGGEIVYATCTLAPEEDEAVLDELLRAYPHQAEIETVDHLPALTHVPGLLSDGTRPFDPGVHRAIRLWPHLYQTSGFFAARIRKTGSIPVRPDTPPARPWAQTGLVPLARGDRARVIADLLQGYGFDLEAVVEAQALALWAREGLVHAIPERLAAQFPDLPHAAVGFLIGQWAEGQFIPSHELITRIAARFADRRVPLSDEQAALWREGRDLRDMAGLPYPPGTVILLEDSRGRFLGRGKVLRDRIRNLLPRRVKR
jgi:16S rRNA (cytosine1407-C5)-methyltransferase